MPLDLSMAVFGARMTVSWPKYFFLVAGRALGEFQFQNSPGISAPRAPKCDRGHENRASRNSHGIICRIVPFRSGSFRIVLETVSCGQVGDLPGTRAGGQDDVSSHKLPQNRRSTSYTKIAR